MALTTMVYEDRKMTNSKYIIFDGIVNYIPVVFPGFISHDVVAKSMEHLGKPVSAGFVYFDGKAYSAFGNSLTLGLSSKPTDTAYLNQHLIRACSS